ncbi:MAG: prepilin-type N-terminal cleavage/methylation domain-containing protein [Candidatus Sericytochromatia bacterium]
MKLTKKGFTLTELVIGLTIGVVVLAILLAFFLNSSKMIGNEQNLVESSAKLQIVLNTISEDIKTCNTSAPTANTALTGADWFNLPFLCYLRPFNTSTDNPICQPATSGYPKETPSYPAAYLFQSQAGLTGTPSGWYPKLQGNPEESNELGFYKVNNGIITRVLYYVEPDPAFPISQGVFILKRRVQNNILTTSIKYNDSSLQQSESVVISGIKYIQFTYPELLKKLDATSSEYDNNFYNLINTVTDVDSSKIPYLQSSLLNSKRNIIGIKIVAAGPLSKTTNKRVNAFGLYTEVNIRN